MIEKFCKQSSRDETGARNGHSLLQYLQQPPGVFSYTACVPVGSSLATAV